MDKQSVRIGIDQLFIALVSVDTLSALTYAATQRLMGVSEAVVAKSGTKKPVYSDDMPQETINQDGETTVTFKMDGLSGIIEAMVLGSAYSAANGLHEEGLGEVAPYLALGYRSKKANGFYKYTWFLKGTISKGGDTSQTVAAEITPQVDTYIFSAIKPTYYSGQTKGLRRNFSSDDANCPAGLTDTLLIVPETGWFSSPLYSPAAPGTAIADLSGATGDVAGEIDLTFTAPAGCLSAKAQIKDPISSVWADATTAAAIVAASTTAVITGLTPGNLYDVRLVVIGGTKSGISNVDEDVEAFAGL